MRRSVLRRAPVLVGLSLCAMVLAGGARAEDSQTFLTKAIQGNLAEISMGQLAQDKGSSPAVKAFGQALVADHTRANENAIAAAKILGVTVPSEADPSAKAMHDTLASRQGEAFDREFANAMVQDHQRDVADYQHEADASKDAAGQYALQTLPVLKDHLSKAQKIAFANRPRISDAEAGLAIGHNSFTQTQIRARLERAGYSGVSGLKLDNKGVWHGTAVKAGQFMSVAVDFRGKIVGQ
jgi:putative membrane protein